MILQNYFLELKNRFILLGITWVAIIFVSYFFKEVLLNIIINDSVRGTFGMSYFIFTNITEVFTVYAFLVFFIGNQVFVIYFFYHLLIFTLPGCSKSEYNFLRSLFITCNFLFFLSIVVFNFFLLPVSWNFFLSFKDFNILKSLALHFEASLIKYLIFYTTFYYYCVFYCQFFLFPVLFFQRIGKEYSFFSPFRKFLYYFCFLLSTMLTPPDVLSQVILSFSFIVSYEVLVFFFTFQNVLENKRKI